MRHLGFLALNNIRRFILQLLRYCGFLVRSLVLPRPRVSRTINDRLRLSQIRVDIRFLSTVRNALTVWRFSLIWQIIGPLSINIAPLLITLCLVLKVYEFLLYDDWLATNPIQFLRPGIRACPLKLEFSYSKASYWNIPFGLWLWFPLNVFRA